MSSATRSISLRRRERRRLETGHHAGQSIGRALGGRAGRPRQRATGGAERVQRAGGGEHLEVVLLKPGATHQVRGVAHGAPSTMRVASSVADGAQALQPETHVGIARVALERRPDARTIHVGSLHAHAVALRVGHQALGGPEAERLGVQHRHQERRRVVDLEPRRAVDEVREGDRVALGEAEVGERRQRVEELVGRRAGDPFSAIPA